MFFLILEQSQELRQNEFRNHAELIRLQTAKLVNMSGRSLRDGETITPTELWKFDWDVLPDVEDREEANLTNEQIAEHNARLAEMI